MIAFQCPCGKKLKARDSAAGKRAKCPACGRAIRVPQPKPPAEEDLVPVVEVAPPGEQLGIEEGEAEPSPTPAGPTKRCPECHVELPASAVLCTTCGLDFRTGKPFEPPKTLLQRIPWKKVRTAGASLAGLAIVIVLAHWAYHKVQSTREAQEQAAASTDTAASRKGAPGKVARLPQPAAALLVRTRSVPPVTPLAQGFTFHYTDGQYSADEALATFCERIRREAAGRLRVAGLSVLDSPEEAPPKGAERLALRLTVRFGWAYQRVAGTLLPKEPYVASCTAHVLRDPGIVLWTPAATYAAPRPGERNVSPEEAQAAAARPAAKTSLHLANTAQDTAELIVKTLLKDVPSPDRIAALLKQQDEARKKAEPLLAELKAKGLTKKVRGAIEQGNPYVVAAAAEHIPKTSDKKLLETLAEQAGVPDVAARAREALQALEAKAKPKAKAPPVAKKKAPPAKPPRPKEVRNPDQALLKLADTAFAGPGALQEHLRLVSAAADKAPHLALAFAWAAATLAEDGGAQDAYRRLSQKLMKTDKPLAPQEAKPLLSLAKTAPTRLLGRAALWTLLRAKHEEAPPLAAAHLARVAAGRLPEGAEAPEEPAPGLDELQLAILRELAQCDPDRGTEAAVALLMRVPEAQRRIVRAHIRLPPVDEAKHRAIHTALQEGQATELRNELLRAVQRRVPLRALLPDLAVHVAETPDEPKLRAVVLYAMASNVALKLPYLWRLLDILQSDEVAVRREAAERLRRLGEDATPVLDELQAAVDEETSATIQAVLRDAIRRAGGASAAPAPKKRSRR